MPGQGGVFKVKVPKSAIPDGWLEEASTNSENGKRCLLLRNILDSTMQCKEQFIIKYHAS